MEGFTHVYSVSICSVKMIIPIIHYQRNTTAYKTQSVMNDEGRASEVWETEKMGYIWHMVNDDEMNDDRWTMMR